MEMNVDLDDLPPTDFAVHSLLYRLQLWPTTILVRNHHPFVKWLNGHLHRN